MSKIQKIIRQDFFSDKPISQQVCRITEPTKRLMILCCLQHYTGYYMDREIHETKSVTQNKLMFRVHGMNVCISYSFGKHEFILVIYINPFMR